MSHLSKDPDSLRQYYGGLLGNSTNYVRDMAAKSFIIVIRKLSVKSFKSHFKRILNALASNGKTVFSEQGRLLTSQLESLPLESGESASLKTGGRKRLFDLLEGVSLMLFYTLKGVKGCLHSKGIERLSEVLTLLLPQPSSVSLTEELQKLRKESKDKSGVGATPASKKKSKQSTVSQSLTYSELPAELKDALDSLNSEDATMKIFSCGQVLSAAFSRLFRHVHPANAAELWMVTIASVKSYVKMLTPLLEISQLPSTLVNNVHLSMLQLVEMLIFALCHSSGRGLSDDDVKDAVSGELISVSLDLALLGLTGPYAASASERLTQRSRVLVCRLWIQFPGHQSVLQRIGSVLTQCLPSLTPTPAVTVFATELLPSLPDDIIKRFLVKPLIAVISQHCSEQGPELWSTTLLEVLMRLQDHRRVFTQQGNAADKRLVMSGSSSSAAKEMGPESWGHSDDESDAGENSGSESSGHSSGSEDSSSMDEEETATSGAVTVNRSVAVLLEVSQLELTTIALSCVKIVRDYLSSLVKNKTGCKEVDCNCLLALKAVQWFTAVVPKFFEDSKVGAPITSLLDEVMKLIKDSSAAQLEKIPNVFLGHLIVLSASNLKTNTQMTTSLVKTLSKNVVFLLNRQHSSIAIVWAVAEWLVFVEPFFAGVGTSNSHLLNKILSRDEQQTLLEVVSQSIATPSYWLRYHLWRVLVHLEPPELKKLTEEQLQQQQLTQSDETLTVDIAKICLNVASLTIGISTEREYSRLLGMLEVACRGGRLPQPYVRLVCSFCLGLVHVKFKPIWEPAMLVLVSAAGHGESEETLWPLLLKAIQVIGSQAIVPESKRDSAAEATLSLSENVRSLELNDSGDSSIAPSVSTSDAFYMAVDKHASDNKALVEPDSRTDVETTYLTVWSILKRCPNITTKRSKLVVPFFLTFLTKQYYSVFNEDPELPFLRRIGLFNSDETTSGEEVTQEYPILPVKTLKKRLEMFLQVFAAVSGPKQLYKHQLLYQYFHEIVSKPDLAVVKLAFDCIVGFKNVAITVYKDSVKRILDDKTIRDELVNLDLSMESAMIKIEHREEVIPLLVRVVFGRFVSKSRGGKAAREQGLARRAAALSFLSKMDRHEMRHLAQLMLRGVIPSALLQEKATAAAVRAAASGKKHQDQSQYQLLMGWYDTVDKVLRELKPAQLQGAQWERQVGFLHLLEQVIRIVGFGLTEWIKPIYQMVLLMVSHAQSCRVETHDALESAAARDVDVEQEDEEQEEEEDGEGHHYHDDEQQAAYSQRMKNANQSARVRTLCLLRVSEFIHQYHSVYDFSSEMVDFFSAVHPLIVALPSSIAGSSKSPALLKIFHALISYEQTIDVVVSKEEIVKIIITCIASQAESDVVFTLMETLNKLLDWKEGASILPHSHLIIQSFSKRFVGPDYDSLTELKLSEMKITPTGSVKQELKLLCRIADGVFSRADVKIDSTAVANLATLLLGMLRTYTTSRKVRVEEEWAINLLRIYKSLLWRMTDVTPHVSFISRLFGPTAHSLSLFNLNSVRAELVSVYAALAQHASTQGLLALSSQVIQHVTAEDSKLIGGRDFNLCMPVFQALSGEVKSSSEERTSISWSALLGPDVAQSSRVTSHCTAMVYEAVRCMFDKELIVRSAALACLKRLVTDAAEWSQCLNEPSSEAMDLSWLDVLRSVVIPAVRRGVKQSSDIVKKGFIMLLAHVVSTFGSVAALHSEEVFHTDLLPLIHEDPEQNFFENITHIQFHRRMRAMNRMKTWLVAKAAEGEGVVTYHSSSFVHVLLPMGYHFLFSDEFQKKDHQALMQEAAQFVGALSLHLAWNHYFAVIKTILKQLGRDKAEKEKVLLTALCAVLDSFHFNLMGEKALSGLVMPTNSHGDHEFAAEAGKKLSLRPVKGSSEAKAAVVSKVDEILAKKGNLDDDSDNGSVENGDNEEAELESSKAVGKPEEEGEVAINEEEEEDEQQSKHDGPKQPEDHYLVIARAVVNQIVPWVKVFLLKEGKDHKGNKNHTVQPHVALALTKLIKRLEPPVVPETFRSHLFVNLVISVVQTLKSRDSDSRDVARDSLAKMISTLGISYMKPVFYELQMILKEGFQRHVCNYTVKSILNQVLENYSPPVDAPSVPLTADEATLKALQPTVPSFDVSLPLIVTSVLDDLTGQAQDDREAEGALRSLIREAKGNKANDTLEVSARCLLFRPTYALLNPLKPGSVSSVHALASPLLELLINNDDVALMGRTSEALQRIALGLSKNPSVEAKELLLYLHATLQPFVAALVRDFDKYRETMGRLKQVNGGNNGKRKQQDDAWEEFAGLDEDLPSYLREESSDEDEKALYSKKKSRHDDVTGFRAATWLPSDRSALLEQRAVVEQRNREAAERNRVQDGASAPKLTGRNRYNRTNASGSGKSGKGSGIAMSGSGGAATDPASLSAIRFCLTLFNSCLRQDKLDNADEEVRAMAQPFLPLLGKCLQLPGASNVVALAVKCITTLVGWGITIEPSYLRALSNCLLRLMVRGGALVSTDNELAQSCIKGLSSLFKVYNTKMAAYEETKAAAESDPSIDLSETVKPDMPLDDKNIRSLLQMLTVSVMEVTSTFQSAAFQLIKEIINTRILLPEVYDLMTKLVEQIVLSQKKGVRESAGSIVVSFILNYPLGEKRVESHLKQLIANCSYEFEDGRLAALETLTNLSKLLPASVLDVHAVMILLPITLRLVNDVSGKCRQAAAELIVTIVRKVSSEIVNQLIDYSLKWLAAPLVDVQGRFDANAKALVRTGAQVASLLVKGSAKQFKNDKITRIITAASSALVALLQSAEAGPGREKGSIAKREMSTMEEGEGDSGGSDAWAVVYQLLCMLESFYQNVNTAVDAMVTQLTDEKTGAPVMLMELIQEAMVFPHAWVRGAALRVVQMYLGHRNRRDLSQLRSSLPTGREVLLLPNGLYRLARRLCIVLNQPYLPAGMLQSLSFCLVYTVRAMQRNPDLAVIPVDKSSKNKARGGDDDDEGNQNDDSEDEEESSGDEDIMHMDEYRERQEAGIAGDDATFDDMSGANWIIQRLRGIGADSRGHRRIHVMKVRERRI